jgi:hypothetical protein
VSGVLTNGAPVSIHYRGGMARDGDGLLWEINGTTAALSAQPAWQNVCPETGIGECVFQNPLKGILVLDDENERCFRHDPPVHRHRQPPCLLTMFGLVPRNVQK